MHRQLLNQIRSEFLIDSDCISVPTTPHFEMQKPSEQKKNLNSKKPQSAGAQPSQPYSYQALKNNFLGAPANPETEAIGGFSQEQDFFNKKRRLSPPKVIKDEGVPIFDLHKKGKDCKEQTYYRTEQSPTEEGAEEFKDPKKRIQKKLQDNVKTILGVKDQDDWIFNLNIGNVMHLLPMSLEELNLYLDNSHELSRDAMLEKIILLTVSYFCVGTELRFLYSSAQ